MAAADAPRKDLRFKVRIKVYGQGLGEPAELSCYFFNFVVAISIMYLFIVFYVLILPFVFSPLLPLPH